MTASRLRLERISLFNYIKYEVIPTEFSERASNEALVYDAALNAYTPDTSLDPSPTSEGRGWVFFDDSTVDGRIVVDSSQVQTSKISVVGASSYTINYTNGRITNPNTVPTSISYFWNYVSVIDRWLDTTPPPLPCVSLKIEESRKSGFQLGGGVKNTRTVYFDIFATSSAEREDISELIHNNLFNRRITIKDFSSGDYLNYDGTFNTSLSLPLDTLGSIFFLDVVQRNINLPNEWSDLNKYRSTVIGTYESLVDSE
jgi:hypothetical protein